MLSMRGIEGRGELAGSRSTDEDRGEAGHPGRGGRPGKRGRRGIKTQLDYKDYERIVGKKTAREERELARSRTSARRGRYERHQKAIHSALENFTPEIKPGNQTALKTRAAPFAVYIARMHRRIHELWGFGFLKELDGKPSTNELNDWTLRTQLEVVINPDGTVDDSTMIAQPSGVLAFDVAALDTLYTAGPFEPPPEEIRSGNGKVYIRWWFNRDWRQCGTFGAHPFILKNAPDDADTGAGGARDVLGSLPSRARRQRRAASKSKPPAPRRAAGPPAPSGPRPDPNDPAAAHVANLWLSGFVHGDVGQMAKVSGVPFHSGGAVVANSRAEVASIYRRVLAESPARRIREWKLLSAAGYRQRFGSLPQGVDVASMQLLLVVRVAREQFSLLVKPDAAGNYQVVGFER
jgi:TonB family protein